MTKNSDLAACLAAGMVARCDGTSANVESLPWNAHPAFPGVELKHLVTGADTDGGTSLHLVRIAPGCAIGSHAHDPQWEVHEVLAGSGACVMDGREVVYAPGVARVLPPRLPHEVRAGTEGLRMLAVFSPALL
ncbi:cupin domain-containing protein [Paucidesulfovibrio longus]|uniref:cupin domain-containing protein n=1 Tax=Paucidesulfovibrio longus TaxID=889 RepID=UPI0003B6C57F|nr:cupin domain-containing protein [Paucidesulfovibrio longus]